ncbi:MAG: cysteine synthase A [Leptospira sp.]|nr:cysteine synthase A [Leptospira sp.]NCS95446.1 cysteine synthase A [Leptospira sp.]
MQNIKDGFSSSVGNTPLIRIPSLSEETGCNILGKAEFLNPGGSVKDRAALFIIEEAERSGKLKKGGTVVEGTAGNTGIGLTHICNSKGYKSLIIIPETQSKEKIELLRTLGAEVRTVPAVPYKDPGNYVRVSEKVASEMDNAIWANQFDNLANRSSHFETTGPEIWNQTKGEIHGWTAAMGTGGTYSGVALYLKKQNPNIQTVVAEPYGSGLYNYFKNGKFKIEGNSITEGIGNSRITKNMEDMPVDDCFRIDDVEAIKILNKVLKEDGLFLGGSVGINLASAVQLARKLGPGHTIVTVLCDGGARYQSKLFNKEFLLSKGFDLKEIGFE